jgi:hypothetical protein
MRKALGITLVFLIATTAVPAAQADPPLGERIIAQENAKGVVVRPTPRSAVQQIVLQERGRQADARLFGPSNNPPVQIVGPPDGFDLGDAGIGGAVALALALLAAAAVAVRNGNRRQGSAGAASAGN